MDTEGGVAIHHTSQRRARCVVCLAADGTMAPILHLAVDNAQKTLRVTMCPFGNSTGSLHQMKDKGKKWFDLLTAGRLHCQMMWFSEIQPLLWHGHTLGIGLGSYASLWKNATSWGDC